MGRLLSSLARFLGLQTPDFAGKFICTVQPNEKVQKYKSTKVQKGQNHHHRSASLITNHKVKLTISPSHFQLQFFTLLMIFYI